MDRNAPWPRFQHQQDMGSMIRPPIPPDLGRIRPNLDSGQYIARGNAPASQTRVMALDGYRSSSGQVRPYTHAPLSQPRLVTPDGYRPSSGHVSSYASSPASAYASTPASQTERMPSEGYRPSSGHVGSYPSAPAFQTGHKASVYAGASVSQRELSNSENYRLNSRQPDLYTPSVRESAYDSSTQASSYRPISEPVSSFVRPSVPQGVSRSAEDYRPDQSSMYATDAPQVEYERTARSGPYRADTMSRQDDVHPEYSDIYRRNLQDSRNLPMSHSPNIARSNAKHAEVPVQQASGSFGATSNITSGQYGRYSDDTIQSQRHDTPANVAAARSFTNLREPDNQFGMDMDTEDQMSICSDENNPDEFGGQPVMMFDYGHGGGKMSEQQNRNERSNRMLDEQGDTMARSGGGGMYSKMPAARYGGRPADRDIDRSMAGHNEQHLNSGNAVHDYGNRPRYPTGDLTMSRTREVQQPVEPNVYRESGKTYGMGSGQFDNLSNRAGAGNKSIPSLLTAPVKTPTSEHIRLEQNPSTLQRPSAVQTSSFSQKQQPQQQQQQQPSVIDDDEDPEFVGAQLYMGNLPTDTTEKQVKDLLITHQFQVWIAERKKNRSDVCAFLKFGTLKEAKAVRLTLRGFVYREKVLLIRLAAALDFEEYVVRDDQSGSKSKQAVVETLQQMRRTLQESTFGLMAGNSQSKGENSQIRDRGENSQTRDSSRGQGGNFQMRDNSRDRGGNLQLRDNSRDGRGQMGRRTSKEPESDIAFSIYSEKYTCETCNITLNGQKQFAQHLTGSKHEMTVLKMERAAAAATTVPARTEVVSHSTMATRSTIGSSSGGTITSHSEMPAGSNTSSSTAYTVSRPHSSNSYGTGNVSGAQNMDSRFQNREMAANISQSERERIGTVRRPGTAVESERDRIGTVRRPGPAVESERDRIGTVRRPGPAMESERDRIGTVRRPGLAVESDKSVMYREMEFPSNTRPLRTEQSYNRGPSASSAQTISSSNQRASLDAQNSYNRGPSASSAQTISSSNQRASLDTQKLYTGRDDTCRSSGIQNNPPPRTSNEQNSGSVGYRAARDTRNNAPASQTFGGQKTSAGGNVTSRYGGGVTTRPEVTPAATSTADVGRSSPEEMSVSTRNQQAGTGISSVGTGSLPGYGSSYQFPAEVWNPSTSGNMSEVQQMQTAVDERAGGRNEVQTAVDERAGGRNEVQTAVDERAGGRNEVSAFPPSAVARPAETEIYEPGVEVEREQHIWLPASLETVEREMEEKRGKYIVPPVERVEPEIEERRGKYIVPRVPLERVGPKVEERGKYVVPALESVDPEIDERRGKYIVFRVPLERIETKVGKRGFYVVPAIERVDAEIEEMREELFVVSAPPQTGMVECEKEKENYLKHPYAPPQAVEFNHKEERETILERPYTPSQTVEFKCEAERENHFKRPYSRMQAVGMECEERETILERPYTPSQPVELQHEDEREKRYRHPYAPTQAVEIKYEEKRAQFLEQPYTLSQSIKIQSAEERMKLSVRPSPIKIVEPMFEEEREKVLVLPTPLEEGEKHFERPYSPSESLVPALEQEEKHVFVLPTPMGTASPEFEKERETCYVPASSMTLIPDIEEEMKNYLVQPSLVKTVEPKFEEERENFFVPSQTKRHVCDKLAASLQQACARLI